MSTLLSPLAAAAVAGTRRAPWQQLAQSLQNHPAGKPLLAIPGQKNTPAALRPLSLCLLQRLGGILCGDAREKTIRVGGEEMALASLRHPADRWIDSAAVENALSRLHPECMPEFAALWQTCDLLHPPPAKDPWGSGLRSRVRAFLPAHAALREMGEVSRS